MRRLAPSAFREEVVLGLDLVGIHSVYKEFVKDLGT